MHHYGIFIYFNSREAVAKRLRGASNIPTCGLHCVFHLQSKMTKRRVLMVKLEIPPMATYRS